MNNFNQHYLSSLIFSPLLYVHKDTHHRENNLYTADNKQTTDPSEPAATLFCNTLQIMNRSQKYTIGYNLIFFFCFFFFGRGYIHIQVLVHCSLTGIRAVETRASVLPSFIKAADYKIILNTSLHTLKQCLHLTLKRILANASSRLPSLLLVYFLHGVAHDSCLS